MWPHAKQFLGSDVRFVQIKVGPGAAQSVPKHLHMLAMHCAPVRHALLHAPQLAGVARRVGALPVAKRYWTRAIT
jgi:hypothetical protein